MSRNRAPRTAIVSRSRTLVEAYEAARYPIESPAPVEAIRFRMEQGGLTVKDLVPSIDRPNRVYEVLNGKRGITLEMIRTSSGTSVSRRKASLGLTDWNLRPQVEAAPLPAGDTRSA